MKSIDTAVICVPLYPDFKPPSPKNLSRPLRVSLELRNRFFNAAHMLLHFYQNG